MLTVFSEFLNSPKNRTQIFAKLIKQKADITCIQETHIKQKDIRLLKQPKLGVVFVSSGIIEKKKRSSGIYKFGSNMDTTGQKWQVTVC